MIYDYIDGKYELSYYLRRKKEYLPGGGGIEHYYINDIEIDTPVYKDEFEIYDYFKKQKLNSRCVLCDYGCINNKFMYDFNDFFSSEYPLEIFDDVNSDVITYIEENLFCNT